MRLLVITLFLTVISLTGFAQEVKKNNEESQPKNKTNSFAYILIEGKFLSKKLKVNVDFGDSPEQLKAGKEYSDMLTNKKSYAAILNYMVDNEFELVQTLDYNANYSGTGGTSGIVFIMRKK